MFDIEHPNEKCYTHNCKFLEEFQIKCGDGKFHDCFRCTLSVHERIKKCPLYLDDLKILDIPDYHDLYKKEVASHIRTSKRCDELQNALNDKNKVIHSQSNELNSMKSKIHGWDYAHQRYNRFHQRILDDTKSLVALYHDRDEYKRYIESLRLMVREVNKEVDDG